MDPNAVVPMAVQAVDKEVLEQMYATGADWVQSMLEYAIETRYAHLGVLYNPIDHRVSAYARQWAPKFMKAHFDEMDAVVTAQEVAAQQAAQQAAADAAAANARRVAHNISSRNSHQRTRDAGYLATTMQRCTAHHDTETVRETNALNAAIAVLQAQSAARLQVMDDNLQNYIGVATLGVTEPIGSQYHNFLVHTGANATRDFSLDAEVVFDWVERR